MTHRLAVISAAFAGALMFSTAASAEERLCTGSIGAQSLDNLRVPDGRTCTLTGTRMNGSVVVGRGATLNAAGIRVNGNVQAEGHRLVVLGAGSTVGGSVQLKQGGVIRISQITTNGDLQLDQNSGRITLTSNRVGANAQVVGNIGGVAINRNTMSGVLECKENSPAPTGSRNVAGDKLDQCAAL